MIELTERPEALYDASVAVTDLALHGCRVGDDAARIDRSLITATIHDVTPDPALLWPDAFRRSPQNFASRVSVMASPDRYHFMSQKQANASRSASTWPGYEWPLPDRIGHVIEFGGKLIIGKSSFFVATGYRIRDGRIVVIDLNAEKIPFLYRLSERDWLTLFGPPDWYEDEPDDEYAEFPKVEMGYNRGLYLRYDKWTRTPDRVSLFADGSADWETVRRIPL